MSLFGTTIELNMVDIAQPNMLDERLVCQILKKHKERNMFLDFLRSPMLNGKNVFEHMQEKTKEASLQEISEEEAVDFVLSELKIQPNGLISSYQALVEAQIVAMDPKMEEAQKLLAKGKIGSKQMPKGYPVLHKRAAGIIEEKVKESTKNKEKKQVAQRKSLLGQMREMSRELFFAVNKLDLEGKDAIQYLRLLYELQQQFKSEPARYMRFKELIATALLSGEPIDLLTIKCLRFVYPEGKRMKILEHMGEGKIVTKDGKTHTPIGEENYFSELLQIIKIFEFYGVKVDSTVLVADLDLDDYFPQGGAGLVPDRDIARARRDIKRYVKCVKNNAPPRVRVLLFSRYLEKEGLKDVYNLIRHEEIEKFMTQRHAGKPNSLVEQRIDYRFNSNNKIFGGRTPREFARDRTYAQLASLRALEVLNDGQSFLVAEPKGLEERMIGGDTEESLPVIFVQLRG